MLKNQNIYPASVSRNNSNREVLLLTFSNREGWYFLAVKKLSALLIGVTSKHKGDFFTSELSSFFWIKKKT